MLHLFWIFTIILSFFHLLPTTKSLLVIVLKHAIMISSTSNTITYICFLCTFSLCFYSHHCSAKNYITTGESIHDGAVDSYLESANKTFQMGFFPLTQRGSERRYLGIWYAMDPNKTVVWVANRALPLPDSTGFLEIAEDGDVKLLDKYHKPYFSTDTGQMGSIGPT